MKLYIAYGSNMSMEQMRRRCPDAVLVGKGMLPEYHLLFKGSLTGSYATIEQGVGTPAGVPVVLWRISHHDEDALDRYEGYPRFYYKTELTVHNVQLYDGFDYQAGCMRFRAGEDAVGMVYIMHEDRRLGVPSDFYFGQILDSYRAFGIDQTPMASAFEYSWNHEGGCR